MDVNDSQTANNRTDEMGASAGASQVKSKKYMFLRLEDKIFAIPLSSVREVLGLGQISSLPNMPSYFAGLINLRGKIVSAVDLKKSLTFISLNSIEQTSKRPCIVITEINGRMFGALADDVIEVTAVDASEIDAAVDGLKNREVFMGVVKRAEKPLAPILNLEKALKVNELIALESKKSA